MQQDPDSKIRDYILKKKQQRERAKQLREARKNKEYKTDGTKNKFLKYRNNHRIIGDPFSTNYANINHSNNNSHINIPFDTNKDFKEEAHEGENNKNSMNIEKIRSVMEEFRGQINTLKSEISDLKFENKQLKQNIIQLQHQQSDNSQNVHHSIPLYKNEQNTHTTQSFSQNLSNSNPSMEYEHRNNQNANKIDMGASLKNLKLKRKKHNVSKRKIVPQYHETDHENNDNLDINILSKSSPTMDLVNKLSEMDNVTQDIRRVQCEQCGRKFIKSALKKHIKICRKIFGKKRKVFDMKTKRLDNDAKNAHNSSHRNEYKLNKIRNKKKQNWKAKSSMLRNAINASKHNKCEEASNIYDDRIECPHCNRRFAEKTAERHIPKCRDIISKPKTLTRKR